MAKVTSNYEADHQGLLLKPAWLGARRLRRTEFLEQARLKNAYRALIKTDLPQNADWETGGWRRKETRGTT